MSVCVPWCVGAEGSRGGAAIRLQREPRVCGSSEAAGEGGELLQGGGQQGSDGGGETPGHPARSGD